MPSLPLFPTVAVRPPFAALLLVLLLAGCQPVMPTSPSNNSAPEPKWDNTVADWPFRFKRHNFGAGCYSTYGCKVIYDNFLHIDQPEDELRRSSDSVGPDYRDNLSGGRLGIQNFPPPAVVSWRSEDGTSHKAEIDMAAIFKDQLILHNVPREKVGEGSVFEPEIILEVNDRVINIYMKARIPTKELQIPGNQYSQFRDDLILAYTRTY